MTDEQLIRAAFERIMKPVCALGWHVGFDYQLTRSSRISAGHPLHPYQTYYKVVFTTDEVVQVYERWFMSCAALLLRLVDELPAP